MHPTKQRQLLPDISQQERIHSITSVSQTLLCPLVGSFAWFYINNSSPEDFACRSTQNASNRDSQQGLRGGCGEHDIEGVITECPRQQMATSVGYGEEHGEEGARTFQVKGEKRKSQTQEGTESKLVLLRCRRQGIRGAGGHHVRAFESELPQLLSEIQEPQVARVVRRERQQIGLAAVEPQNIFVIHNCSPPKLSRGQGDELQRRKNYPRTSPQVADWDQLY